SPPLRRWARSSPRQSSTRSPRSGSSRTAPRRTSRRRTDLKERRCELAAVLDGDRVFLAEHGEHLQHVLARRLAVLVAAVPDSGQEHLERLLEPALGRGALGRAERPGAVRVRPGPLGDLDRSEEPLGLGIGTKGQDERAGLLHVAAERSEERRVGKSVTVGGTPSHKKKKHENC